jgi:hypothetical protein
MDSLNYPCYVIKIGKRACNFNPLNIEIFLMMYTNSVPTSQEIYYISVTEISRLMLFRETSAVYCENRMKHTNTLYGQNAEF